MRGAAGMTKVAVTGYLDGEPALVLPVGLDAGRDARR